MRCASIFLVIEIRKFTINRCVNILESTKPLSQVFRWSRIDDSWVARLDPENSASTATNKSGQSKQSKRTWCWYWNSEVQVVNRSKIHASRNWINGHLQTSDSQITRNESGEANRGCDILNRGWTVCEKDSNKSWDHVERCISGEKVPADGTDSRGKSKEQILVCAVGRQPTRIGDDIRWTFNITDCGCAPFNWSRGSHQGIWIRAAICVEILSDDGQWSRQQNSIGYSKLPCAILLKSSDRCACRWGNKCRSCNS